LVAIQPDADPAAALAREKRTTIVGYELVDDLASAFFELGKSHPEDCNVMYACVTTRGLSGAPCTL
jgi:hypothetical protein